MQRPDFLEPLAMWSISISAASAIVMIVLLSLLVVRRTLLERKKVARKEHVKGVLKQLLAWTNEQPFDDAVFRNASQSEKLEAVLNLHQLVRGQENARLEQFVAQHDLLAAIERQSRHHSANRRIDAVRQLEGVQGEEAVRILSNVLHNDPNLRIRMEAAATLAQHDRLPDPRELVKLLDLKKQLPTRLHRAVFRSSAERHSEEMMEMLRTRIPVELGIMIIDALGWSENFSVLPIMEEASEHPDSRVRNAVLLAARQLQHPIAEKWIIKLLEDEDDKVRAQAVLSCIHLGLYKTRSKIAEMQSDPSPWVRFRSASALKKLSEPTS